MRMRIGRGVHGRLGQHMQTWEKDQKQYGFHMYRYLGLVFSRPNSSALPGRLMHQWCNGKWIVLANKAKFSESCNIFWCIIMCEARLTGFRYFCIYA
jgi:hypothetical protein